MKNFTNGALVFRIWKFDGTGEVLAKFAYMNDAVFYCKNYVEQCDRSDGKWFLLAVCEYDCDVRSFLPPEMEKQS